MNQKHSPARLTRLSDCRHGRMLYFGNDRYVGGSLEIYGDYCEDETQLFDQVLRPGHVVVEAGANIGAHTVHLSQAVGPSGQVFAFEPQRLIYQLLCANLALNECHNVFTYRAGLGATQGRLKVPPMDFQSGAAANYGGLALREAGEGEDVPVLRLDDFSFAAMELLKIDVEGMEVEVIKGAAATLARHRPIIYTENDRPDRSAALITMLTGLNYHLYWHIAPLFRADNFRGVADNVFPGLVAINMLCIPAERGIATSGGRRVTGPDDWWNKTPA